MPRKTRRKIKRKRRGKSKPRKHKSFVDRHLDSPITTRWTKQTTYWIMAFELVFVIWWLQDTILNWQEIILKFRNIFNILFGWIGG